MWLFISLATQVFLPEISTEPCDEIRKNSLKLSSAEAANSLEKYCGCTVNSLEFKKVLFSEIPNCLQESITKLKVEQVELSTFPDEILELKNLEELSLRHTNISFLPGALAELSVMKVLDLRGTSIVSLPDGLDHLERIDLRLTDINREDQNQIRSKYPEVKIFFSSPCNCD
ncbi:MAG: hypothetical protein AAGC47_15630 [Bacteroidota bacterium]